MFEPQPGMRVVVRYSDGGQLTDALGHVLAADADSVTVDSKRGPVRIEREAGGELDSASAQVSQLLRPADFSPSDTWLTMTAPAREVAGAAQPPQGLEIVQSDQAHAVHLAAWGHDDTEDMRALLHSAPQVIFLSAVALHPDGSKSLVGTVRLAIASKWGWLDNLVVNPQLRRSRASRRPLGCGSGHPLDRLRCSRSKRRGNSTPGRIGL